MVKSGLYGLWRHHTELVCFIKIIPDKDTRDVSYVRSTFGRSWLPLSHKVHHHYIIDLPVSWSQFFQLLELWEIDDSCFSSSICVVLVIAAKIDCYTFHVHFFSMTLPLYCKTLQDLSKHIKIMELTNISLLYFETFFRRVKLLTTFVHWFLIIYFFRSN